MEAENSTGPSVNANAHVDALNRQLIQLLISDIENLRALYQLYTAESARGQLMILYRRAREYLEQLESYANSILLEHDELKQLQEDKAFLEKLIFELTGSFEKAFLERLSKHGRHGRRGEKPDEEEMKKAFSERIGLEAFGPWGFGRGFEFGGRGGFGPRGFGPQGPGPQSFGPQCFGPPGFGNDCFGQEGFGPEDFGHGGPFGGDHFGDHFSGRSRGGHSRGGRGGWHRHGMDPRMFY